MIDKTKGIIEQLGLEVGYGGLVDESRGVLSELTLRFNASKTEADLRRAAMAAVDKEGLPWYRWAVVQDHEGFWTSLCISRKVDDPEESYMRFANELQIPATLIRSAFENPLSGYIDIRPSNDKLPEQPSLFADDDAEPTSDFLN